MSEIIRITDCVMTFDDEVIINHINLSIKDKEFLTLLGSSGCGKTTTLRIIGGFETPTSGSVYFDGVRINDVPPHKRKVNTVFQRYALFPHLNVFENIAFGLRISKTPEPEIKRRVGEMLALVGLPGYDKRRTHQLSGGQQQRVAIARALVNRPRVLLLDEPLGALDLKLRKQMQRELKAIQQQLGITFVYVTHDQEEALTMSDTVVVMNAGEILQVGTPTDIYNEPANAYVADFIGESNIIQGVMIADELVEFAGARYECVDTGFDTREPVDIVIRPEDLKITPLAESGDHRLTGVVTSTVFIGVHYEMMIDTGSFTWMAHNTQSQQVGSQVALGVAPNDIHIMRKAVGSAASGNEDSPQ